jgi:hypothetical protein
VASHSRRAGDLPRSALDRRENVFNFGAFLPNECAVFFRGPGLERKFVEERVLFFDAGYKSAWRL